MAKIHFICRDRLNLHHAGDGVYTSGNWVVSTPDANALRGGMLFLHQTKAKPSYFGGRISSFVQRPDGRIVFTFTFEPAGRGTPWPGPSHARAWTSGVLP